MEICKLCQERSADKTNTHYLTDAVIRSCLNEDGSNVREKAMAFNISSGMTTIEARFQRNTSQKGIKETFGREARDEEIEAAKTPMFAVDYVFCSECEKKFTATESPFLQDVLPDLRAKDFTGQSEIELERDMARAFFLLQVYRTAVCDPGYRLTAEKMEKLRKFFNEPNADISELRSIPLNVTYLNTLGGEKEFTTNTVGIGTQNNNRSIFFNDFIIQTSSDDGPIQNFDFYGLNQGASLQDFTNLNEESFRMRTFDNNQRKALFWPYHLEKGGAFKENYRMEFTKRYIINYRKHPHPSLIEQFVQAVIYSDEVIDEPRYSEAHFEKMITIYIDKFRPSE